MLLLGGILLAIWVTLALTKLHALLFVAVVLSVGLLARALTKWWGTRKGPRVSLLRQAVMEQLPPEALAGRKLMIGTYGSEALATRRHSGSQAQPRRRLVVCFIREVSLSYKYDGEARLTIDTDQAAPEDLRADSWNSGTRRVCR